MCVLCCFYWVENPRFDHCLRIFYDSAWVRFIRKKKNSWNLKHHKIMQSNSAATKKNASVKGKSKRSERCLKLKLNNCIKWYHRNTISFLFKCTYLRRFQRRLKPNQTKHKTVSSSDRRQWNNIIVWTFFSPSLLLIAIKCDQQDTHKNLNEFISLLLKKLTQKKNKNSFALTANNTKA